MRIVLADLRASEGLVSKDTVAGGFGSRHVPFSRTTKVYCWYSNVQAALGLAGLAHLETWTKNSQDHASVMSEALSGLPGVHAPYVPLNSSHVYYQYCVYVPDRDVLARRSIRRGLDLETLHVDVCTELPLFEASWNRTPGACQAASVVQMPVYSSLSDRQAKRIARKARHLLSYEGSSVTVPKVSQ